MSRRIVQLTAVVAFDPMDNFHRLYALDNNGVAWLLENPGVSRSQWERLPELPSLENRRFGRNAVATGASEAASSAPIGATRDSEGDSSEGPER